MKKLVVNTFVLLVSVVVLHSITYLGSAFLFSADHLLIPRSLPSSVVLDILILCVLPAVFIATAYVLLCVCLQGKEFLNSLLNLIPHILLVAVTLTVDDTFSRVVRDFSERDFFSYTTSAGIAFVFPNIGRTWFVVIFASIILSVLKREFWVRTHMSSIASVLPRENAKSSFAGAIYYVAAFFMPSILLFNLYNGNRVENHIVFQHVLVLAGVLATLGILIFLIFKRVSKNAEVALLLCILFWLSFWLFEVLFGVVATYYTSLSQTRLIIALVAILVLLAMVFRMHEPPFAKVCPVFNVLAICLLALFVFNITPGVNHELTLHRARVEMAFAEDGEVSFYMKRDFHIDPTLPTPDIVWIHMDGMMSLETVESFWGISKEYLREEVTRRGFLIYEEASLHAGGTNSALTALLSPAFYDSFWGERLTQVETELRRPASRFQSEELTLVGLTYEEDIVPYFELLVAFIAREYEVVVRGLDGRIPHSFEHLTGSNSHEIRRWHRFLSEAGDLPELLTLTTPINTLPLTERIQAEYQQIEDGAVHYGFPRFYWYSLLDTHASIFWRHDPSITEEVHTAVHVYPLAHAQIARRGLDLVDTVLEENPNTVIVMQADHGFHSVLTQEHLLNQGYSINQVVELNHSVFSAVRVPPAYGELDAPISPLNITRELVNRFVGENYTLLQND